MSVSSTHASDVIANHMYLIQKNGELIDIGDLACPTTSTLDQTMLNVKADKTEINSQRATKLKNQRITHLRTQL